MSTTESNSLIQYKDKDGNIHIIYPVTKAENVDGIEDVSITGNAGTATAFKMQDIPEGSDLNDFLTPGFYGVKNANTGATILNSPILTAFSLLVMYSYNSKSATAVRITQIISSYSTSSPPLLYIRKIYSSTFGKWERLICKSDLDSALAGYLPLSGGTLTGELTLSGDPTSNLHAATKKYVDTGLNEKAASSHNHSASNITSGTLPIARGGTGATTAANALKALGLTATAAELNKLDGVTTTKTEFNYLDGVTSNIQTQLNSKLSKSGGTMTGALTLSGDPTSNLHAATKQYVDTELDGKVDGTTMTRELAKKLDKTGGTMTGNLTLSGDPSSNLHAATKQYVDEAVNSKSIKIVYGTVTTGGIDNPNGQASASFGGVFTKTPHVSVVAQIDRQYSGYEAYAKTPMIIEDSLNANGVDFLVKKVSNSSASSPVTNCDNCTLYWMAIGE